MKNSIKREQSQACLNFAERKNFRLQAKYKILMTLALLLTAVTGAWAQSSLNAVEIEVPAAWENDDNPVTAGDLPGFSASTYDEAKALTGVPQTGRVFLIYAFDGDAARYVDFEYGSPADEKNSLEKSFIFSEKDFKFYYTAEITEWSLTPGSSANTWTFSMPGSDVVLTPIYAKAAAFATTGTEPEVKTLLPEAAEGVIAGTDAPLIAKGTGIVAFAGTSTEVKQGTLMYAIGTSATEAPALTAFSATVPTAKNIADDGADVYVWYYIKGADAPEGQQANEENTFNDTEPACLTVQVLTNKFDIQFNAANANTIEAGKATVTVGGTAATVTEGKLQGVKMGSEVKMTAKDGYKFRKVEVKKGVAKTFNCDGYILIYEDGDTWTKVVEKNPDKIHFWGEWIENVDSTGILNDSDGNGVKGSDIVDPNEGYYWGE